MIDHGGLLAVAELRGDDTCVAAASGEITKHQCVTSSYEEIRQLCSTVLKLTNLEICSDHDSCQTQRLLRKVVIKRLAILQIQRNVTTNHAAD